MPGDEEHYRKLERLYLRAPTNQYYRPSIRIGHQEAEVEIAIRPDFFHTAGATHGSIYFKVLDDSAFFAVNSVVPDVFVLTVSYTVYLTRPITEGTIKGSGRLVHASKRLYVAEATATDSDGNPIATGSGTFMRSSIALTPEIGYY